MPSSPCSSLATLRHGRRRASELERSIAALVAGHPLLELPGVGILTAARLVAEAGDVKRFRSPAAFAMLAGVAPIPASSGEVRRMRLNRGGNRRLNRALYTIALSQAWHHEPAKAYIARKRLEPGRRIEKRAEIARRVLFAAGPQADAGAVDHRLDAEAIPLDLEQPAGIVERPTNERREHGRNEASGLIHNAR